MLLLLCPPKTELEQDGFWLGSQNTRLGEIGRTQVGEFANHATWIKPTRLYAGPAMHLREVTEMVFPTEKSQSVIEFSDRAMGGLTGRSYRETLAEFPRRNWLAWQRSFWIAPPGGESMFDISERVLTAYRTRILPIAAAETVVIVCAADIMRLIIGYINRVEEEDVLKTKIEPLVPYVIGGDLVVCK